MAVPMTRPDDIDTAGLRDLLAKATPGPWRHGDACDSDNPAKDARWDWVAGGDGKTLTAITGHDDAAYIAALDPATVLALLDVVDNATTQQAALEALAEEWEALQPKKQPWSQGDRRGTLTIEPTSAQRAYAQAAYELRRALGGDQHQEGQ